MTDPTTNALLVRIDALERHIRELGMKLSYAESREWELRKLLEKLHFEIVHLPLSPAARTYLERLARVFA
jgi:hypothetical protein